MLPLNLRSRRFVLPVVLIVVLLALLGGFLVLRGTGGPDEARHEPGVAATPEPTVQPRQAAPVTPAPPSAPRQAAATPQPTTAMQPALSEYYVSPSGNDANPGSFEAPFASLQTGLDRLGPGQTLYIRGGTYRLTDTLVIRRSGTAEQPITIRGYLGEEVVLDGGEQPRCLTIRGQSWIVIDGLTLQQCGSGKGHYGLGIEDAHHITLTNLVVHEMGDIGLYIARTAEYVTVRDSNFSKSVTGIVISGRHIVVDNVQSYDHDRMIDDGLDCDDDPRTGGDHGGQAFSVEHTSGPVEIRNSRGWNNRAVSKCYGHDGAFVELFHAQNVSIHHNFSRDGEVFVEAAGDTRGNRIWRNEVWNEQFFVAHQANDIVIANNTAWNERDDIHAMVWINRGGRFGDGNTAGLLFVNNIIATPRFFFQFLGSPHETARIDYNLYHRTGSSSPFVTANRVTYLMLEHWQAGAQQDRNSKWNQPLLVDGAAGRFQLTADSPAIDAGMVVPGITDDYHGAAPDIGRWEHDH